MALKLQRDIIAAVLARRLRTILPSPEEIREVANRPDLSDAACDHYAQKIAERAARLATQLINAART
jgi:hypothetical protein